MGKERQRKNSTARKRKQLLSKRTWSLHGTAKPKNNAKVKTKAKTITKRFKADSSRQRREQLVNFLADSDACVGPETHSIDISRKVESFTRYFIMSLNYMASSPVSIFCACMSLCCNGLNKGLNVMNRGKKRVHTTLSSSVSNGYCQLQKTVGYVGDAIFPSRSCKRKLDEMSGRLEEVEKQLKRLKRDVMFASVAPSSSSSISEPMVTSQTCAPLPPPPPPPPPPPICKPPPMLSFKKSKKAGEGDPTKKKESTQVGISLEEITNVKLRKVIHEDERNKENISSPLKFGLRKRQDGKFVSPRRGDPHNHPFVNLRDIKKVSLRKTPMDSVKKTRSPGSSNFAFLKTSLRKVNMQRSPGGTPLTGALKESHGEGLTLIMTRALQRKFKFANPPSADSFEETSSFLEKTLNRSISPCSPMTRLKVFR